MSIGNEEIIDERTLGIYYSQMMEYRIDIDIQNKLQYVQKNVAEHIKKRTYQHRDQRYRNF